MPRRERARSIRLPRTDDLPRRRNTPIPSYPAVPLPRCRLRSPCAWCRDGQARTEKVKSSVANVRHHRRRQPDLPTDRAFHHGWVAARSLSGQGRRHFRAHGRPEMSTRSRRDRESRQESARSLAPAPTIGPGTVPLRVRSERVGPTCGYRKNQTARLRPDASTCQRFRSVPGPGTVETNRRGAVEPVVAHIKADDRVLRTGRS